MTVVACTGGDGGASAERAAGFAQWTLGEPEVRIGGIDERGGVQLSEIRNLIALDDGTLFVRDSKIPSVLRFEARGNLARQIGGGGQGPSEFGYITFLGVRGESLWVADVYRRRMVFFSHDGDLRGARPWLPWNERIGDRAEMTVRPRGLLPGGLMLAYIPTLAPPASAPASPPHGSVGPLALVDSTSTVRDTILWLAQASEVFMLDMKASGYLHFPGPNHFIDTPLWHVASDGTAIVVVDRIAPASASESEYRVRVWNAAAALVLDRRVPFTPVPVATRTVDSIIDVFTDDMASLYPSRGVARGIVSDSLRPPAFYPPVTDIVVGTDGRIWLAREGLAMPPFDSRRYDVLDATGKPTGQLALSRPGRILAATRSFVWVVELDADDVPTILRYPIVLPTRSR